MAGQGLHEITNILIGTGLSMESLGAIRAGAMLGKALGAATHAMHVVKPMSAAQEAAIPELAAKHLEMAREELRVFAAGHGLSEARLHAAIGSPVTEFLRLSKEMHADLLIVGRYSEGGLRHDAVASAAHDLVRTFPVSVLVVPPSFQGDRFARIGVATDLAPELFIAVRRAIELAILFNVGEIAVLHAHQAPVGYHTIMSHEDAAAKMRAVGERMADAMIEKMRAEYPACPAMRLVTAEGDPEDRVGEMAAQENLDLLVVSTHTRSAGARVLLGRTTEAIMQHTPCSVWAERAPRQDTFAALKELLS